MFKKNSWIVALLLALSLTAFLFTGCVNPLKVVEDTETYEEYPLDKGYNAWAGQVYQKGWAIGGIKFQGKGDAIVVAKDLGYDIEMFQKATKLKIEMPDASYPRSGVDIIWGGEDASGDSGKAGGMWNQQPIAGGSGDVDTTFAKKDGNVLIIDLTKALKNYSAYTKAAKLKIVMQVNAPSYGDVEGLVQKAFLMIPNTPPPFVSVGDVSVSNTTMYWTTTGFPLEAIVLPSAATNNTVTWAITKWEKGTGNPEGSAPAKLDLSDLGSDSFATVKGKLLGRVNWLQEEYVTDDGVYPNDTSLKNVPGILIAPADANSIGKVTLRAVIKDAIQDKKTGKFSDYIFSPVINILDPPFFTLKVGGVDQATKKYGAVDNRGIAIGGKMEVVETPGEITYRSYKGTFGSGGSYGNAIHYFEVNLGTKKLENFSEIRCHYKGLEGDINLIGKSVRVKAMAEIPSNKSYNPGPFISTTSFPSGTDVTETDLVFKLFEDNSTADGKQGIYNKGKGADLRQAATDDENSKRYDLVKNANKVYVWFLPWCNDKTSFVFSDIEFVLKP